MKTEELKQRVSEYVATSIEHLGDLLVQTETYFQLAIILIILLFARLIQSFIGRHFLNLLKDENENMPYTIRWYINRSERIFFPLATILLLLVLSPLMANITGEADIIEAVSRVSLVWLMWTILQAYIVNTLVRTVGLWILVPAAFLQLFGLFDVVAQYLDSYGFILGEIEITAYTLVKAIFFFSVVFWLGKIVSTGSESYIRSNESLTRATKELLIKLFDIVLYAILFLMTLNLVGIDLTALTVFGGALGVGIGFGLQKIASNFISGIILLTEKSININNLIEMDDGVFGYVRKLGARASIVETFDGKEVMIPNEDFITSRVANLTHSSRRGRIEITIGVSYDTDLRKAFDLILESANAFDNVLKSGEFRPKCFLREFGDNSVNFLLTVWLDDVTTGRWRLQSDIMFEIWENFKEHDIEIPFPQRDIHIRSGLEGLPPLDVPPEKSD